MLRTVLDEHYAGRTPKWSELEGRFLTLTRSAGLPDPEVNTWIVTDEREPALRWISFGVARLLGS